MALLLYGNITSKMKYIYLLLISFSIFSCDKEKCYTIEGKEIINGDYYFLLDNNWSMNGFWAEIYSNHAISMITMDITVAATSYLVFIIYQFSNKKIDTKRFLKYLLSLFLVGFSLSMPLYLYDNYKN